jgi:hypothetical protein
LRKTSASSASPWTKHLLTVDGELRPPEEVYRKVQSVKLAILANVGESGLEEIGWGEKIDH